MCIDVFAIVPNYQSGIVYNWQEKLLVYSTLHGLSLFTFTKINELNQYLDFDPI